MAKRVRVSRSAHRPGGQGPTRTRKASEADLPATTADDLSASGMGAAGVEVDEVAVAALAAVGVTADGASLTQSAETVGATESGRRATRRRSAKRRTAEELGARATAEDAWVREDLRRIGVVSVVLLVVLFACWLVFGAMDVLGLY